MSEVMPFRVFEYNCLTALAMADEARANKGEPVPIDSVVVILSGREEPWPTHGSYRTSAPGEPFSGVHFRLEAVCQRTVAELEARGSVFWLIMLDLPPDVHEHACRQRARSSVRRESSPLRRSRAGLPA
ncbi:hypothetical protein [Sorangium sp. So ce131]|uniref:hypothetical protein n=1 Tax=Sorangium sp. So ce131 TaxID=3133282 RepID=UPI003F5D9C4B